MPNLEEAEMFEKQLSYKVFLPAMTGAFLHRATAFVGAATLTWATVVIMGGFASEVPMSDFLTVTLLVILIACLLGLALLSSKLVTKKNLYKGSLDPVYLCYHDKRPGIITIIQIVSICVQLLFIFPCRVITATCLRRKDFKAIYMKTILLTLVQWNQGFSKSTRTVSDLQACVKMCEWASESNSTFASISSCSESCFLKSTGMADNLQVSLYIFFWLVEVTLVLAFFSVCYIAVQCLMPKRDLSLKKYHDEVMSRALNVGLVVADEFDAREFFLNSLAEDLVIRNIGPLEVKKQNSTVIDYLFKHPKGVEMVYEGLTSGDTMRQQTAANIVGFWAPRKDLGRNKPLLSKLAEKLGLPGKTAEAAANSFSALAIACHGRADSPLLEIKVASHDGQTCNVVEKVVHLVLRTRLPTVQVYVRLLDSFFMSRSVRNWLASRKPQDLKDMKRNLIKILVKLRGPGEGRTEGEVRADIDTSVRARTGIYAFSALDRLMDAEPASSGNAASSKPQGTTSAASSSTNQSSTDQSRNDVISTNETGTDQSRNDVISTNESSTDQSSNGVISTDQSSNTIQSSTENSTNQSNTDHGSSGVISTNQGSANRSSNGGISTTTNNSNHGPGNRVMGSPADIDAVDWPTQAGKLLSDLDGKLKEQEFMWYTDAKRYRELCEKYSSGEELGTWLDECVIRGEAYENLP